MVAYILHSATRTIPTEHQVGTIETTKIEGIFESAEDANKKAKLLVKEHYEADIVDGSPFQNFLRDSASVEDWVDRWIAVNGVRVTISDGAFRMEAYPSDVTANYRVFVDKYNVTPSSTRAGPVTATDMDASTATNKRPADDISGTTQPAKRVAVANLLNQDLEVEKQDVYEVRVLIQDHKYNTKKEWTKVFQSQEKAEDYWYEKIIWNFPDAEDAWKAGKGTKEELLPEDHLHLFERGPPFWEAEYKDYDGLRTYLMSKREVEVVKGKTAPAGMISTVQDLKVADIQ